MVVGIENKMLKKKKMKNKNNGTMGSKIRKLRLANHLTQEALAEKLFVSDGTISKWEKDISAPNYNYLKSMSKIFKVKASYFLEDTSPKSRFKLMIKVSLEFTKSNWYKIIILAFFLFLFTYFVNTYDSLEMYEISSLDENVIIDSGYYIKSRNKIIININNIKLNSQENNIINQKIKLFTLDVEDKIYFYESDDLEDIKYKNFIGYDLSKDCIKNLDDSLYLEIENLHSDNTITTYETKLSLKLSITNSSILYFDDITIDEDNSKTKNSKINEYLLFKNNYKIIEGTSIYYKNFKDYKLYFDLGTNKMIYEQNNNSNINLKIIYYYDVDRIFYQKLEGKEIIINYFYNNIDNDLICNIGNCDNYLKEYNQIKNMYYAVFS